MFNIWTFLLEIVNFLVLLWILKRLLYRPILGAIEERRERARRAREELEAGRRRLEEERRRQEEALRAIDRERGRMLAQAREEAERERQRLLGEAKADIRELHERERAALEEERRRALQEVEGRVLEAAVRVSEGLLSSVAGHSLHDELVGLARRELDGLSGAKAARALEAMREPRLRVASALPLSAEQRRFFQEAAARLGGLETEFSEEVGLRAGARIELGELVLDASLASQIEQVRRLAQERLSGRLEAGG